MGFGLVDEVPDATTVWLFRKQLSEQGLIEALFEQFDGYLIGRAMPPKVGRSSIATLIPVPKQHNSDQKNEQIKQGEIPQAWQDKPHQLAQKDTDARWTKKGDQSYFGYKDHIGINAAYGLIRCYAVTDASVHDSQVLGQRIFYAMTPSVAKVLQGKARSHCIEPFRSI